MLTSKFRSTAFFVALSSGLVPTALAQFTQQGGPLTFMNGGVAISADGNTVIVGDFGHDNDVGGALVFTRTNGAWSQQGAELVGTGSVPSQFGSVFQGSAVALSADGNTALVGGPFDGVDSTGAVWVFTRSNGAWSQQGLKLVISGGLSNSREGSSVALSSDGNTAIIAGGDINDGPYVFTRSNGVWTQLGGSLTGGLSGCFQAVAISSDGNAALVGNFCDDPAGSALVFTRSGGVWSQQGTLVGSGAIGDSNE